MKNYWLYFRITPTTPVEQQPQPANSNTNEPCNVASTSEQTEIPDNVTAELEKLEDENAGIGEVEGVGDLLGDLGEDDDDEFLKSFTADMGVDFNILGKYSLFKSKAIYLFL